MIAYATVSEIVRNMKEQALSADWETGTRCWEYGWVLRNGDFRRGLKCLDAGCGQAPLLGELAVRGCEPHGLDYLQGEDLSVPTTYGVPRAWITANAGLIEYHHGSMFEAPLPDDSFDRVTCVSVLEHIYVHGPRKHEPALLEMKRILKPGGLLIVTVDFFLNPKVTAYDYRDDLQALDMDLLDPAAHAFTREEILADEDAFFIPPERYIAMGFGTGFNRALYHRLTSVGYILRKRGATRG
jgi:SAM-dependent methyltransferase